MHYCDLMNQGVITPPKTLNPLLYCINPSTVRHNAPLTQGQLSPIKASHMRTIIEDVVPLIRQHGLPLPAGLTLQSLSENNLKIRTEEEVIQIHDQLLHDLMIGPILQHVWQRQNDILSQEQVPQALKKTQKPDVAQPPLRIPQVRTYCITTLTREIDKLRRRSPNNNLGSLDLLSMTNNQLRSLLQQVTQLNDSSPVQQTHID